MAPWKYFKQEVKASLPSPLGSLAKAIPTGGIVTTSKEVQRVIGSINDGTWLKRSPYEHFNDKERTQIAKYTADHGVAAAVRHFKRIFFQCIR